MFEVRHVRQIPGERERRWFSSAEFELFVQSAEGGGYSGFQLYYDKSHNQHAIVFSVEAGFRHMRVDDGEQRPGKYKASPVLLVNGALDLARVYSAFIQAGESLPDDVKRFVTRTLEGHPDFRSDLAEN